MKKFNTFSHQGNANHKYIYVPSHPSQNGDHEENKKQKMLARIRGSMGTPL
jgi:hypothetical protein